MITCSDLFEVYLTALSEAPSSWARYTDNVGWTAEVARALARSGRTAFPHGEVTARGHRDTYTRGESLAFDVCITDPDSWAPPRFVAHHERTPRRASIHHAAWKLLATHSEKRILVAYYDAGSDVRDRAALEEVIRDVAKDNPGVQAPKDIYLFSADYNARPSSADELRALHASTIIGVLR